MIRFENVCLAYGALPVLKSVTFRAAPGEHAALMGPSGCGKTSMLLLAAGLIAPTAGTVQTQARRTAVAFQEPRLLPRRTAAQNVNLVLGDRAATMPRALAWLEAVGLGPAADKLPAELSGGMRQRLSLARALAYEGDTILLDEPLKELDEQTRESVLALLCRCTAGKTLLLTTHDMHAARALDCTVYAWHDGTFLPV